MGPVASPVTDSGDTKMFKTKDAFYPLPKHSYWLDFWVFVMFDIALFLVVHFLIP